MSASQSRALVTIALLALGCASVLWITQQAAGPRIESERAAALRSSLAELAGNTRVQGLTRVDQWPLQLCDQMTLVRFEPRGYGGAITMAVALTPSAAGPAIHNLQTVRHAETPGIGDFIAERGSAGWLHRFRGSSASSLSARAESLDAVSGATITVRGVRRGLLALLADLPANAALFSDQRCQAVLGEGS